MIIAVIVLGVLVAVLLVLVVRKASSSANEGSTALLLKQDLTKLSQDITQLKDGLQIQIGDRLERNQAQTQATIQRQFSESSRIIADVNQRLTKLDETNKRVVDVADELKLLQNILQNPKQRGGLGEYYLDTVLGNVLPPNIYEMQYKFNDGEIVDAIIKLDKGRILPIDSKFSLENYNRLIEEPSKPRREDLAKLFRNDLKTRIDETSKYIRPAENTLDYAFMFIPLVALPEI
jgi:DNA recombination protein RmuC